MRPLSFNGKALTRTVDNYWYNYAGFSWFRTTFNSQPYKFFGDDVWTDGTDIYYSHYNSYKLDKSTMTWNQVTIGGPDMHGVNIWHDGENTYYNEYSNPNCYVWVWDKSNKRFNATDRVKQDYVVQGPDVWHAGGNVYFSMNTGTVGDPAHNLVWNRSTSKWVIQTWTFIVPLQHPLGLMGRNIWHDYNGNTYTGDWDNDNNFLRLYKLNLSTSTWDETSIDGHQDVRGIDIWTDYDGNMQYSNGLKQYTLDRTSGKWVSRNKWLFIPPNIDGEGYHPYGEYIWTDGSNIYYSYNDGFNNQINYVLKR